MFLTRLYFLRAYKLLPLNFQISECYGIPSQFSTLEGWLCQRCTLGAGKERCQLCPFVDGALKKTDNGGWAHILCAQYIPEVSVQSLLFRGEFRVDFEVTLYTLHKELYDRLPIGY